MQSGCACRGDAGLAHPACLIQKAISQRAHRGSKAWTTCQTCSQQFGAMGLVLAQARCERESTMDARSFLGAMMRRQGRSADAERTCRGVLAESRSSLGDEHMTTTTGMTNLAAALSEQGKYAESESILREALHARDDPGTRSNLAVSLCGREKYAEAESILRGVVLERELSSGSDHEATLQAKCNLGVALAKQHKIDEAEALFHEVVIRRRRVFGEEHSETLLCQGNLASLCLLPRGRCAEAETIQRSVLSIQRRTIGEEHPHTLMTGSNLAHSIWGQGRHEEARELARVIHAARVRTQGRSHPHTESSARTLAQFSVLRARRR